MKKIEMHLKSAIEIIKRSSKALVFYKNKNRQCFLAYKFIIKGYPAYDEKFFYEKLKPYIINKKKITILKEEKWIKENSDNKKSCIEAENIEKRRFDEFCAGEEDIWENTYGTNCPYL